jgi:hypothetical protein
MIAKTGIKTYLASRESIYKIEQYKLTAQKSICIMNYDGMIAHIVGTLHSKVKLYYKPA